MGVRVLGRPALVGASGETSEIRGSRQMGLLAILVAHRGRPVRHELLHEELWTTPPGDTTLRVTVKRLRDRFVSVTGCDPILSRPAGYVLDLDDSAVDESRFGQLVTRARLDPSPQTRVDLLRRADSLWVGDAFEGTNELPSVQPEHVRLDNLRHDARELLAASLVSLRVHSEAIQVLRTVIDRDPYRESAWALRIIALYRSYRQQEALATYEEVRRILADDIGIQPGRGLSILHRQMLDQVEVEEVGCDQIDAIGDIQSEEDRSGPDTDDGSGGAAATAGCVGAGSGVSISARPYVDRRSNPDKRRGRFVGRRELLGEADRFVAGELDTTVFVVDGPAGMGKTSFGRAVASAAGRSGLSVSWGTCPRDTTASMVVVQQILADLASLADPEDRDVALARTALNSAFPQFDGPPDARSADGMPLILDPSRSGDAIARVYSAAERLFRSIPTPHIAVIDDGHWISQSSADLISYVAGVTPGIRWLVLARNSKDRPGFDRLMSQLARGHAMWHELGPLSRSELSELLVDHLPDATAETRAIVIDRSGGHPFLATELMGHLSAGGEPASTPRTVEAVVAAEVHSLGPDAQALCHAVSIAGEPLPSEVVVAASGVDRETAGEAIETLLGSGLVSADPTRDRIWPAHDLIRAAVATRIETARERRIHKALAEALAGKEHEFGSQILTHLLASGPVDDPAHLDAAAATVIATQNARISPHEAVEVGARYLTSVGPLPSTREGIQARIHLAAAHIQIGDASKGERIISAMASELNSLDDPALLADALVTRSPLTVAGSETLALADEGAALLGRLPSDDGRRRVLLASWVGHLYVRAGRPTEANRMAILAEAALGSRPDVASLFYVHTLRLHRDLAVDVDPALPDQRIEELQLLAETTNDPAIEAAVAMARLDSSLRAGTLHDFSDALRAIESLPAARYHADLRWTTAAGAAALDLARGDVEAAGSSYLRALQVGSDLSVNTAFGASLLHRLLLDWDRGTLHEFHTLLPPEPTSDVLSVLVAHGLVAIEAGDVATACRVADALAEHDDVLSSAGATGWQVVATVGSELAWRTGHVGLATNLGTHLRSHAGYGLSMNGLAYLGAADRVLGLCAATLGEFDVALSHLRRAHEDDKRRGAPRWAARSAVAAAEVLERRDEAGDRDQAALLRAEAGELAPVPPAA